MNVDGALKNSLTSGGGIARNSEGEVMGGFSCPFDYDDILAAELDAILEGVKMCRRRNLSNYIIMEMDSSLAYSMICDRDKAHWRFTYELRRITMMLDPSRLHLIYREENKVADLLAKMAQVTQD